MKRALKIMHNKSMQIIKKPSQKMSMRDMLKITRNLNEEEEKEKLANKKTVYDQKIEEDRFLNFFSDTNIHVIFTDLVVTNDFVFWGGTINGILQFIYKVLPNKQDGGVEYEYLEDFSEDNPDNEKIMKNIELYYEQFFKYWNNNLIQ